MRLAIGLAVILACLAQSACSMPKLKIPRVHKVTVQQGNVITQRMVDELKPGLTRSQVAFIMGEPVFRNSFDDDRWDYLYSVEIPGVYKEQRRLTVYFEGDVMTHFDGDYAPSPVTAPAAAAEAAPDQS